LLCGEAFFFWVWRFLICIFHFFMKRKPVFSKCHMHLVTYNSTLLQEAKSKPLCLGKNIYSKTCIEQPSKSVRQVKIITNCQFMGYSDWLF
jgi:hypothetical protein